MARLETVDLVWVVGDQVLSLVEVDEQWALGLILPLLPHHGRRQ
jgi:hypothetical protein